MEEIITQNSSTVRRFRLNQSVIEKLATNLDIFALPLERLWIGVELVGGAADSYTAIIAIAKKSTYLTIVYAAELPRQLDANEYDTVADVIEEIISKNNIVHIPVEICLSTGPGMFSVHLLSVTLREYGLRCNLSMMPGNRDDIKTSLMMMTEYLRDRNLWWCKSNELLTLEIFTKRLRDLRFILYVFPLSPLIFLE